MEVTDRTLLGVGTVTFIVALGCFSIILLNVGGMDGITGFAVSNTSYGYVNVSVAGVVSVQMVNPDVDFGSGVTALSGATNLYSNGTQGGSGFSTAADFQLKNNGNVHANVTINGSTPRKFYGNTTATGNYTFFLTQAKSEAIATVCTTANSQDAGIAKGPDNETQFAGTHQILCPNMTNDDATDEFNVTIHLTMQAADNLNGSFTDTIEFQIYSLGHS
jgi:hypothetical protein